MTIHFICRGNVLRSLIAETYLKSLQLPNITVLSSGTGVDFFGDSDTPYFNRTVQLLKAHDMADYIKSHPEQLTQERLKNSDVIILMNQRVVSDAEKIVTLPAYFQVWEITDIGEGTRIEKIENGREVEEVIFDEIIYKVDALASSIKTDQAFLQQP